MSTKFNNESQQEMFLNTPCYTCSFRIEERSNYEDIIDICLLNRHEFITQYVGQVEIAPDSGKDCSCYRLKNMSEATDANYPQEIIQFAQSKSKLSPAIIKNS